MISLSRLNKLIFLIIIFTALNFNFSFAEDKPEDIWEAKDEKQESNQNEIDEQQEITIESPILSNDVNKITVKINEEDIDHSKQTVIGIIDPQENDFTLNMWSNTNGADVKKILKRIDKLKLSDFSENLLFKVLFTNAYPLQTNLTSKEFLKIKIDWLIKNRRIRDLETFLKKNPEVGQETQAIKFLVNEYLSSAEIKMACEKVNFISQEVQNNYLDKFMIYCLINNDRKEEAQLIFDLLKERGLKDNFFENKINFLLGISEKTNQKILDNNLLNFYLSHITADNFNYVPNDKTDKYIWRYLSAANLVKIEAIDDEDTILTYEKAALDNSFKSEEIFNIYKQIVFNVSQLINATEIYKNLPNYKARALIYQSILLSYDIERKLYLTFLLKDLFEKDQLLNVYSEELTNILESIDPTEIPESYSELVERNLKSNLDKAKIEFNNDILHKSKILRHFIDENEKKARTEKDFKAVYKKIKRNKKYFISIKDIIVLESLALDGFKIPKELDYKSLAEQLTIPQNLEELAIQNQTGLVMLKIIEIIGEDKVRDLDPETIYFLNSILNKLNLKKIRNSILSEVLPVRV